MILHRDDSRRSHHSRWTDARTCRQSCPAVGRRLYAAGGRATPCVVETTNFNGKNPFCRFQREPARHRALHACRPRTRSRYSIHDRRSARCGRRPWSGELPLVQNATARSSSMPATKGTTACTTRSLAHGSRKRKPPSRLAGARASDALRRGGALPDDKPYESSPGVHITPVPSPPLTTAQDLSDRPVTFLNDAGIDGGERREPFVIEEQKRTKETVIHVR